MVWIIRQLFYYIIANYKNMSKSLIRKNQLHPDIADLVGQYGSGFFISNDSAVFTTGDQTISGVKTFATKIKIGNFSNAIYVDNDGTLIISGRDVTPQGMKFVLANNIKETSITFDPDYHGLVFQGDSYYFENQRPQVLNTDNDNFTLRDVALLDEVVLNTGNQTISGAKIFANKIGIGRLLDEFGFVNSDDGLLQIEGDGVSELRLGGIGADGTKKISFYDDGVLNFQIINDVANDYENVHFSGRKVNFSEAVVAPNIVYNTGNQTISGVKTFANSGIFNNGIDLNNSRLINSVPQLVTQAGNFSISGNSNGRMIISNASTLITGTIMSGNATGFNASIIQVGAGQIQITGVGAGIKIDSYNNQYRTAGQFATISLLHTGNNGYIMYGNTST